VGFRPPTYEHLLSGVDANNRALFYRVRPNGEVLVELVLPAARFFSFDGMTFELV
jgi:hypothetical protein